MTGRLLDEETGAPVAGALIFAFHSRTAAADEEWVRLRKKWRAEERAHGSEGHAWSASARTEPDGSFRLRGHYGVSTSSHGLLGIWRREGYGAYQGAEVLRIEIEGRSPILIDAPRRGWSERVDPDDPWLRKAWAMGDVLVPSGSRAPSGDR